MLRFVLLLVGSLLLSGHQVAWAAHSARAHRINGFAQQAFGTDPRLALRLAQRAEAEARTAGDRTEQAVAWANIGSAHYILEHYEPALRAYLRALALHQQTGNARGESATLNNLGNLHYARDQFGPALKYYERSLWLDRQRGDSVGVGDSYLNLANVLSYTHQIPRALAYSQQALQLFRTSGERGKEAAALNNVGALLVDLHRYAEARPYVAACLRQNRTAGDIGAQAINLQTLGDVSRGLGEWAGAAAYYTASIQIGRNFSTTLRDNYKRLAQVQAHTGDFAAAYASHRRYTILKDSIFSRETTDRLAELETRYQSQQQQRRILLQQADLRTQRVALSRKSQLIGFGFGTAALVLLGAAGLWHQVRQKNRINQLLANANAEIRQVVAQKETLIQEVHHRVKNNLQMVSSLLTLQATADPAARPAVVESQARIQAMALVHEYLYRANDLAQIRLDTYLGELLASLHAAHTSTARPLHLATELAPLVVGAKEAIPLGLLVNELVTNAYKHAFRGRASGHVSVTLTALPAAPDAGLRFSLRICDDGVGGSEAESAADAGPASSSAITASVAAPPALGMQLVRLFTRQLKATLSRTVRPQGGTCFEIRRDA